MAQISGLQATLTVTPDTVLEGTTAQAKVNIRNTIGNNIGFFISSIVIGDDELVYVADNPTPTYIGYGSNGTLTQDFYVEFSGDTAVSVTVGYNVGGGAESTTLVSPPLHIQGNLEFGDNVVDSLILESKRVVQLDTGNDETIWKNGIWFQTNPTYVGYDRLNEDNEHQDCDIIGTFYHHNHLLKNGEVEIYPSNPLGNVCGRNNFDFFTTYGALTVTRTLHGFTASGEQQAVYTCKTGITSNDKILFDITDVSGQVDPVYLEVFTVNNDYDRINLTYMNNSHIEVNFTSIRDFTISVDGEEYDSYSQDDAYDGFRFNIGNGHLTVDEFRVEKKLTSSQITNSKLTSVSDIDFYQSFEGIRCIGKSSNSKLTFVGNILTGTGLSRFDFEISHLKGAVSLRTYTGSSNLFDFIKDRDEHKVTVIYDGKYIEIFVDGILQRSIKYNPTVMSYGFSLTSGSECIIKNLELHQFRDGETVTTDSNGEALIPYISKNRGTVYALGLYDTIPSIPFSFDDAFYSPIFSSSTVVVKMGGNIGYLYRDSDQAACFKGAVFEEGWSNSGRWECVFDLAYNQGGARYTGLVFGNPASPWVRDSTAEHNNTYLGWGISNWEGPITSNPRDSTGATSKNFVKQGYLTSLEPGQVVSNSSNPNIGWHTIHMRKDTDTRLVVWKNDDYTNRVIYEWEELSEPSKVTVGGCNNWYYNSASNQYGYTCIRNLRVKHF